MMLNPNNIERINSIDILSHSYFEKFQLFDNNNFKPKEFIKNNIYKPVKSISKIKIKNKVNNIIISQNNNYSEKEYIDNKYELKIQINTNVSFK